MNIQSETIWVKGIQGPSNRHINLILTGMGFNHDQLGGFGLSRLMAIGGNELNGIEYRG
jgi:hypothetical protein